MVVQKLILLLLLFAPFAVSSRGNSELRSIKEADQADRRSVPAHDEWHDVMQRDNERRERVIEILKEGRLSTAWDYFNAALVMQHGDSAEDVRLAHSLSTIANTLDPDHKNARWLMAASWDRLMMRSQKPQWYGTQSIQDSSGKFVLYPVDPDAVTDADRATLGVPSLTEAQALIDHRNGNR